MGLLKDNVYSTGTYSSLIVHTVDGGGTWNLETAATTDELYGVEALSPTNAWAVGSNGLILHYSSGSWTSLRLAGWSGKALRAIGFSGLTGWAVGDSLGIARTTDGGLSWSTFVPPSSVGTLRSVAGLGVSETAIAVGDSGKIEYVDFTWAYARPSSTSFNLGGVTFVDASSGCAVGDNATVLRTANGGQSWAAPTGAVPTMPGVSLAQSSLRAVAFADTNNGVAVGQYAGVWRTLDGGASWVVERLAPLENYSLRGASFTGSSADTPVLVGRFPPPDTLTNPDQTARVYVGTWSDRVDRTPPTTVSDAQAAYVGPATIHLTATDASGVAHTYYKVDGGSQTEGTTAIMAAAGSHVLEFWSVDASPAQNIETPHKTALFTITIPDVTAPTTVSDAVTTYVGPATIHLTATDNPGGTGVAHTYYVLDGAPQAEGVSVEATTAGPHTLEFWSEDVAGNVEMPHETATFTVTIPDTIAPVTTSDVPALRHYDSSATIQLTATDNVAVAHTYWKLDGSPQSEALPINTSVPGSHTLEFWSVDAALNVEPTHTVTFTVAVPAPPADRAPPATTSSPAGPYTDPATIRLTATDLGGSGVASTFWKLDRGAQMSGLSVVVTGPGAHSVEFWSVDVAGNIETHHTITVTIPDTTAPVTDSDALASYLWTANIHLTATDNIGVAATCFILDGLARVQGTTVSVATAGSHTLEYWSVDAAGNVEAHKTAKFVVTIPAASLDTVPPVTSWSGWAATFVNRATIVLSASDGDGTGVAGTYYTLDSGRETPGTTVPVTAAGAHTISFWSVDKAGNRETPHDLHFTVLIATKLSITSNHTSITHRHPVVFSGTISPNVPNNTDIGFYVLKPGSHSWVRVTTRHTYSSHHWNCTYAPASKGTWYFRVVLSATSKYGSSTSSSRKITVR